MISGWGFSDRVRLVPNVSAKAREFAARLPRPAGPIVAAASGGAAATLYLYDQIGKDPWTGEGIDDKDVVAALAEVRNAKTLDVRINSPGGEVFTGIAIANAIRAFGGKTTVYVDGVAASIASVIALAGDKIVTGSGAMWMVHDPAAGIMSFGTADQIEDDSRKLVAALRKVRENLLDSYATATKRPVAELSAWMTAETWMTAAEAMERGFTHEVARAEPAEEEEAPAPHHSASKKKAAAHLSPSDTAERARIKRRELDNRFSGTGARTPCRPGPTQQTPKENES